MAVCADKYRDKYAGKYALCAGKRKKRQVDRFFFEGKKRERERGRESEIKREKRDTGTVLTRAAPDIPRYNGDNKAYLDPVHVSRKHKPIQRFHPRSQPQAQNHLSEGSMKVLYPHLMHPHKPIQHNI